ncbi:MAG TPA: F0F1 ATP synthase subunit B [Alphaproteobacteria bacterium]|nr:F0F1 ATP synthase subunit B [Alphaproteobacteria bacterium]
MLSSPEFWVAVAFAIFAGLVYWKGAKPLLAALDSRANRIRQQVEEARSLRAEAERALGEANRKTREATREVEAILAQARSEAERLKAQAAENLEATLKRREQNAVDKIAQAEVRAVEEVRGRAVEIAVAATAKLLQEQMDGAHGERMVEEAITEIGRRLQ